MHEWVNDRQHCKALGVANGKKATGKCCINAVYLPFTLLHDKCIVVIIQKCYVTISMALYTVCVGETALNNKWID